MTAEQWRSERLELLEKLDNLACKLLSEAEEAHRNLRSFGWEDINWKLLHVPNVEYYVGSEGFGWRVWLQPCSKHDGIVEWMRKELSDEWPDAVAVEVRE